jgi:hypothetical protein
MRFHVDDAAKSWQNRKYVPRRGVAPKAGQIRMDGKMDWTLPKGVHLVHGCVSNSA